MITHVVQQHIYTIKQLEQLDLQTVEVCKYMHTFTAHKSTLINSVCFYIHAINKRTCRQQFCAALHYIIRTYHTHLLK